MPGFWQTTYWPTGATAYWPTDYWPEFGAGLPPTPTVGAARFIVFFSLIFGGYGRGRG